MYLFYLAPKFGQLASAHVGLRWGPQLYFASAKIQKIFGICKYISYFLAYVKKKQ